MSGTLGSSNIESVLTESRTRNLRGEGERSDHCATEAPEWIHIDLIFLCYYIQSSGFGCQKLRARREASQPFGKSSVGVKRNQST